MREILFRGKRADTSEWVVGCLILKKSSVGNETLSLIIGSAEWDIATDFYHLCDVHHIIPETVGQYTGLTDKNDTKIFEGDIVDILTENEEIGVVDYEDGGFLVNADGFSVDFHTNIYGTDLEVIGNIHDNPELLGGAKNG